MKVEMKKSLEGRCHCLIEVLPVGTEENHKNTQPESRLRLEPNISRIQFYSVTTTTAARLRIYYILTSNSLNGSF
jgi:hypothetical protein